MQLLVGADINNAITRNMGCKRRCTNQVPNNRSGRIIQTSQLNGEARVHSTTDLSICGIQLNNSYHRLVFGKLWGDYCHQRSISKVGVCGASTGDNQKSAGLFLIYIKHAFRSNNSLRRLIATHSEGCVMVCDIYASDDSLEAQRVVFNNSSLDRLQIETSHLLQNRRFLVNTDGRGSILRSVNNGARSYANHHCIFVSADCQNAVRGNLGIRVALTTNRPGYFLRQLLRAVYDGRECDYRTRTNSHSIRRNLNTVDFGIRLWNWLFNFFLNRSPNSGTVRSTLTDIFGIERSCRNIGKSIVTAGIIGRDCNIGDVVFCNILLGCCANLQALGSLANTDRQNAVISQVCSLDIITCQAPSNCLRRIVFTNDYGFEYSLPTLLKFYQVRSNDNCINSYFIDTGGLCGNYINNSLAIYLRSLLRVGSQYKHIALLIFADKYQTVRSYASILRCRASQLPNNLLGGIIDAVHLSGKLLAIATTNLASTRIYDNFSYSRLVNSVLRISYANSRSSEETLISGSLSCYDENLRQFIGADMECTILVDIGICRTLSRYRINSREITQIYAVHHCIEHYRAAKDNFYVSRNKDNTSYHRSQRIFHIYIDRNNCLCIYGFIGFGSNANGDCLRSFLLANLQDTILSDSCIADALAFNSPLYAARELCISLNNSGKCNSCALTNSNVERAKGNSFNCRLLTGYWIRIYNFSAAAWSITGAISTCVAASSTTGASATTTARLLDIHPLKVSIQNPLLTSSERTCF